MKALISMPLILLVILGCGRDRNSKKEPLAKPEVTPIPIVQPTTSIPVPESQPTLPYKKLEEECKEKEADFDWVGEKCIEKPNTPTTGPLNIVTGTVWSPSSENCTRVYRNDSEDKPKTYQRCAGVDVTIPLVKPIAGQGTNTLKLSYNCSMVVEFPVEIKLGSTVANVAPRNDDELVFSVETPIEADSNLAASIKLIPNYNKVFGAFAVSFPEACRIIILENSASPAN